MGTTRTEQAIEELLDTEDEDFEPTCDDVRLAWLSHEMSGSEFEAVWSDR